MPCSMWGSQLPNQGLNLCPLRWKHRVLTTRHPGKSPDNGFDEFLITKQQNFPSMCSWTPILTEAPKGQLTCMSGGWGTPNKLDLGFLGGKRLGAVSAEGTPAHFLPAPFSGQKASRLFGFHFSTNRRGSCSHHGLPGLERWSGCGQQEGADQVLSWVTCNPPLPHSCPHLPDPPNLESTGS